MTASVMMPFHPADERFLDLPGELQISPDHDVDDAKVTMAGSSAPAIAGGVVADVTGEEPIEPGVEFGEEPHGRALYSPIAQASVAEIPDPQSPARARCCTGPTPGTARPGRAPGAWSARSAACPARLRFAPLRSKEAF